MRTPCLLLTGLMFAAAARADFPGALILPGGEVRRVLLVASGPEGTSYRPADAAPPQLAPPGTTVFIEEPADFAAAVDLYQGRKYAAALKRFRGVRERLQPLATLPDNPATLAGFYEMECLRKLGDLEALASALQTFSKAPLTRDSQLKQLEIYVFWDAVRTKSWRRLDEMAQVWANTRLPGGQRAQIAWCHGQALEGLGRPADALVAYQTALTADAAASDAIGREAALRVLAIYRDDPAVKAALESGQPDAAGKLQTARAVARLFRISLGGGAPLPADLQCFDAAP